MNFFKVFAVSSVRRRAAVSTAPLLVPHCFNITKHQRLASNRGCQRIIALPRKLRMGKEGADYNDIIGVTWVHIRKDVNILIR